MRSLQAAQRTADLDPQDPSAAARLLAERARVGLHNEATHYIGKFTSCVYRRHYYHHTELLEGEDLEVLTFKTLEDGTVRSNARRTTNDLGKTFVVLTPQGWEDWGISYTIPEARSLWGELLTQGYKGMSEEEIRDWQEMAGERGNGEL